MKFTTTTDAVESRTRTYRERAGSAIPGLGEYKGLPEQSKIGLRRRNICPRYALLAHAGLLQPIRRERRGSR